MNIIAALCKQQNSKPGTQLQLSILRRKWTRMWDFIDLCLVVMVYICSLKQTHYSLVTT